MRPALIMMAMLFALTCSVLPYSLSLAQAQECTGENCPPPATKGGGDHDCEHEKKEDTVS